MSHLSLKRDINTFEVDIRTFEVDIRTFEVDVKTFEVVVRTFEVDVKTFEVDVKTFEVDVTTFKVDVTTFEVDVTTFKVDVTTFEVDVDARPSGVSRSRPGEMGPDLDFRPMVERYFSEREQADLCSLPESKQSSAFYRCWVRKEAYIKATGTGFSQPSNGFDVWLLPGERAALLAHRVRPGDVGNWTLRDLDAPEGYRAALAVEGVGKVRIEVLS